MKIFKPLGIIALILVCCTGLTSCTAFAEKRIESKAKKYIKEKYGIEPEIKKVTFQGGGDLATPSQRKSGGYVTMEYNGKEFWVSIHLDKPENNSDTYMREEVENGMTEHIKSMLNCEDIFVSYLYDYNSSLTKDVRSWQDLVSSKDYSMLEIRITTYGLDKESVKNFDAFSFGENAQIFLADRSSKSYIKEENYLSYKVMPENEPDLVAYYYFHDGTVDMKEYR